MVHIHFHYIKVVITCICMLVKLQSKPLFPEHAHVKRGLSCGKRRRKETKRSFLQSASSLSLFHQKPISCEKKTKQTHTHMRSQGMVPYTERGERGEHM